MELRTLEAVFADGRRGRVGTARKSVRLPSYDASMLFFLSWDQSRPHRIVGLPGTVTDQWSLRKCTLLKLRRWRKPYRPGFMAAPNVSFIGWPRNWSHSDRTVLCTRVATRLP